MKRIICVDDDTSLQSVFQLIFERAGYQTTIFSDGNKILKNEFEVPDIFILDKQLPGINGLEICRLVKSRTDSSRVPVIIISASPSLATDAADAGADGYLEKPFHVKSLLALVERIYRPRFGQNTDSTPSHRSGG